MAGLVARSQPARACFPLFERGRNLDGLRQDPEFAAFMQDLKAWFGAISNDTLSPAFAPSELRRGQWVKTDV